MRKSILIYSINFSSGRQLKSMFPRFEFGTFIFGSKNNTFYGYEYFFFAANEVEVRCLVCDEDICQRLSPEVGDSIFE